MYRLTYRFPSGLFLSAALVVVLGGELASADPVRVTVSEGVLVGESGNGVATFMAIPYAAPPVGERRWRPPEAPAPWTGERSATAFGPACMQTPYPAQSIFSTPVPPTSEDCLTLNVWTAALAGKVRRPVMVWLHGGGLTRGSGSSSIYDGTNLARKGVVLVTLNYRLGAFGYLAHPELTAESDHHSSGNYGVLDQIAALRWIKSNIVQFGGDSNNITIFGESAGSTSVSYLSASPLAAGLFDKAIAESGGRFDPMPMLTTTAFDLPPQESSGERLAAALGAQSLAELRRASAALVLAAFDAPEFDGVARANVDGWVLPDHVARLYASGKHNRVPLLLGSNKDEGTSLVPAASRPQTAAAALAAAGARLGPLLADAATLYDFEGDPEGSSLALFRDMRFGRMMQAWAVAAAPHAPVWLYYFTFEPGGPYQAALRAYHAAEIRFVFDNGHMPMAGAPGDAREQALGHLMSDYWVSFAATGIPRAAKGPRWPAFTAANGEYLEIGATPRPDRAFLGDRLPLMQALSARVWRAGTEPRVPTSGDDTQ